MEKLGHLIKWEHVKKNLGKRGSAYILWKKDCVLFYPHGNGDLLLKEKLCG